MTSSRRDFLKGVSLSAGGMLLSPMLARFAAEAAGVEQKDLPQRFVFVMKSSGVIPETIDPPTLKVGDKRKYINESLADHKLPSTLKPLESFKDQLSIVPGISGKMCRGGH